MAFSSVSVVTDALVLRRWQPALASGETIAAKPAPARFSPVELGGKT